MRFGRQPYRSGVSGRKIFYFLVFYSIAHYFILHRFYSIDALFSLLLKPIKWVIGLFYQFPTPSASQSPDQSSYRSYFLIKVLDRLYSIFKVVITVVLLGISGGVVALFNRISSRFLNNNRKIGSPHFLLLVLVNLVVPLLVHFIVFKYEIVVYVSLPLFLCMFTGILTYEGEREEKALDKMVRNFILFEALILIIV